MDKKIIGKWLCKLSKLLGGYEPVPPIIWREIVVEEVVVKETPPINYELPSPRATIKFEDIVISSDGTVHVKGILPPVTKFTVPNTNSMEMAIDEGHYVIASAHPYYKEHLEVGEVIVFNIWGQEIIHAIWEIGEDEQGWYCKTKGWNPYLGIDPWIVRREQISWVCRQVNW